MNLSILQGRLSSPELGYQETPADWKREFSLLESAGLSSIEWVITKKQMFNNPFFNDDLSVYPVSVVCADHVIDERVFEKGFFFDHVFPVCEMSQEWGVKAVAIPLLEASEVNTQEKKDRIIENLIDCCDAFKDLDINIEAETDADTLLDIVSSHENLKVTYDTGNLTALNVDHDLYIDKVYDKITNIHLKDRSYNYGSSKRYSEGDTDFDLIFKKLASLNYNGIFTLQMARGDNGNELSHVKDIAKIFRRLHEKHF